MTGKRSYLIVQVKVCLEGRNTEQVRKYNFGMMICRYMQFLDKLLPTLNGLQLNLSHWPTYSYYLSHNIIGHYMVKTIPVPAMTWGFTNNWENILNKPNICGNNWSRSEIFLDCDDLQVSLLPKFQSMHTNNIIHTTNTQ